jgi:hypothetical protein
MRCSWLIPGVLLLAACGSEPDPATGGDVPVREGPARPPEAQAEGMYTLTGIDGGGLPGVVQQTGDCRVEVLDASLRLEAGRFAFQNRTRETCGAAPAGEPVMHAAGGTYEITDGTVVLQSDVGTAFSRAHGSIDSTSITLRELSTQAGTETVMWLLQRSDAQQTAPGGTTGGDNRTEAELSRTPGVTTGGQP